MAFMHPNADLQKHDLLLFNFLVGLSVHKEIRIIYHTRHNM